LEKNNAPTFVVMIFRNILFHAFELLSLNLAVAGAQSSESTSLGIASLSS